MSTGPDIWASLLLVQGFVEEAKAHGIKLLCFPENLFYRGPLSTRPEESILHLENRRLRSNSQFSKALCELIENSGMYLSLGSVLEASEDPKRPYNAHWWVSPKGEITSYRKIHLFEFDAVGASYRESKTIQAGSEIVSAELEDFRFGLSICFDLRFPELYRRLTLDHMCNVLLVPAAFTYETGRAHWHTLLKARAIENQAYVLASAQWGTHLNDEKQFLNTYGHSLAVDPWGQILAEAGETKDALLVIDLSQLQLAQVRSRLPALRSVQKSLFF